MVRYFLKSEQLQKQKRKTVNHFQNVQFKKEERKQTEKLYVTARIRTLGSDSGAQDSHHSAILDYVSKKAQILLF